MLANMSRPLLLYVCFVAVFFGAAMGSFLNCAAWRIARSQSFLRGRSRCPACGHVLEPLDLIPLASWLLLRGRCRYCGGKIALRYELAECLFAAATAACLLRFGFTPVCLRNYVFLCCLFCLSLVDLDVSLIPDGCLILPALAWVAALPFAGMTPGEIGIHVLAAVLFGGSVLALSLVMDRVMGQDTMGGGDIKLYALSALYLGMVRSLFLVIFSCVLGLLFALMRRSSRREPFPFGPSIALSAAFLLLWGDSLAEWYIRMIL